MRVEDRTTFVLPGTWWTMKTDSSETQMVASIKNEVERTVGRSDDRAALRREIRTQLLDAAHEARRLGAARLYIAEEITPGVPLSASLTVVVTDIDPVTGGTVEERAAGLANLLGDDAEVCDFVEYPLVRTTRVSDRGDETVPLLKADYLLTSPVSGEVLMFAFASAFVAIKDDVLELFDAILTTVDFPEHAATSA